MKDEEYINPENKVIRNGGKAVSMKNESSSNKLLHNENINYKSSNITEDDSFAVDQTNDNIVLVGSKEQQENHNGTQRTTQEQFRNGSRQQKKSYITKKIEINEKRYDHLMNQKEAALKAGQDTSKIDKELENLKSTILSDYKSRSNIPSLNKHIKYERLTEEQKFLNRNAEREKSFVNYKKPSASITKGVSFATGRSEEEVEETYIRNGKLTIDKTYEERLNELQGKLQKNKYYKKNQRKNNRKEARANFIQKVGAKTLSPYRNSLSSARKFIATRTKTGRAISKISSAFSSNINKFTSWKTSSINSIKAKISSIPAVKTLNNFGKKIGNFKSKVRNKTGLFFAKFSIVFKIFKIGFIALILITAILLANTGTKNLSSEIDEFSIEYQAWNTIIEKQLDEKGNKFYDQYHILIPSENLVSFFYAFRDDAEYERCLNEAREEIANEKSKDLGIIIDFLISPAKYSKDDIDPAELYKEVYERGVMKYLEYLEENNPDKEHNVVYRLSQMFLKEVKYSYSFLAIEWEEWNNPYRKEYATVNANDYELGSFDIEKGTNPENSSSLKKIKNTIENSIEDAIKKDATANWNSHDEYKEDGTQLVTINYSYRNHWTELEEKYNCKEYIISSLTGKKIKNPECPYTEPVDCYSDLIPASTTIEVPTYSIRSVAKDSDGFKNIYWTADKTDPKIERNFSRIELNPEIHQIQDDISEENRKTPPEEEIPFPASLTYRKQWEVREVVNEAKVLQKQIRFWETYTFEEIAKTIISEHNPTKQEPSGNNDIIELTIYDSFYSYPHEIVIDINKYSIFTDYYTLYQNNPKFIPFKDNLYKEKACMSSTIDYSKLGVDEGELNRITKIGNNLSDEETDKLNNYSSVSSIQKASSINSNICYIEEETLSSWKELFQAINKYLGIVPKAPDFTNIPAWKHPYGEESDPRGKNTGGPYGQCTWFAAGMFYQTYDMPLGKQGVAWGNGNQIVDSLLEAHPAEFTKSDIPVAGAIFSAGINDYSQPGHTGMVIEIISSNPSHPGQMKIKTLEGNFDHVNNDYEGAKQDWNVCEWTLSELKSRYGGVIFANPTSALSNSMEQILATN